MNYANHDKSELQHFYVLSYFFKFIYTHFKMSKDSSGKYYQKNKERL